MNFEHGLLECLCRRFSMIMSKPILEICFVTAHSNHSAKEAPLINILEIIWKHFHALQTAIHNPIYMSQ